MQNNKKNSAKEKSVFQKHSVYGSRVSGVLYSSFAINIGSDHEVVTTVQWTVVSESPSSYAAKAAR